MESREAEMKLRNRLLTPDEIEVRIAQVNAGGVRVLFYKDARVDQSILDEIFGPFGWRNEFKMIGDGLFCTISIWDDEKREWVAKENVGTPSNMEARKGESSDAFKRAGFNLGIGRELYSLTDTFIPKNKLISFQQKDGRYVCYDSFSVVDVDSSVDERGKKTINSITVKISHYSSKTANFVRFSSARKDVLKKTDAKSAEETDKEKTGAIDTVDNGSDPLIKDDETILIGKCRNFTYQKVKDTNTFKEFLSSIKDSTESYSDPKMNDQFVRLKALAQQVA